MRPIDADQTPSFEIEADMSCGKVRQRRKIRLALWRDIEQMPTVDAVPVVRCKDCRWGQMDDLGVMHCHKYHMHKNVDGFCDEGERKEPENENTYSSI